MNLNKKLGLKVLGLVVFSLLLAVNCAEEGTAPTENIPPNTFVTNYQIDIAPDSATAYNARIYWRGNDVDGAVFWYEWRIANANGEELFWHVEDDEGNIDTVNISTWQATNTLTQEIKLDYPTFDTRYVFEVRGQDNDREYDPTPAVDTISIDRIRDFNYAPNTEIVVGPPNGAVTGAGIYFLLRGTDIDGMTDTIAYMLEDDAEWTNIATDVTTGYLELPLRDVPNGPHTVTFKAIDNFRKEDPTPVSVSFVVDNTILPELSISVMDGQQYVVPFTTPQLDELTVTITATVDFYYSAIDSFHVVTSAGDDLITTETEVTFTDLGAGDYWIDVTAYDIGGNSAGTGQVNFSVVELLAGDGVLCVNGIDWGTYGAEADDFWENGVAWGNLTSFKCWDLIGSPTAGGDFADSLLGDGAVPTWMMDTLFFDAISWMWNSYAGDDEFWYDEDNQAAIMAYLEMGGNVLLGGRHGHFIFEDDDNNTAAFAEYCQYASYVDGLSPSGAVAVDASMIDMTGAGLSFTNTVTLAHPNLTRLLETNAGDPDLGWVITPNGAGGGGAVAYIGGREYRWDPDDLRTNFDAILTTWFGLE